MAYTAIDCPLLVYTVLKSQSERNPWDIYNCQILLRPQTSRTQLAQVTAQLCSEIQTVDRVLPLGSLSHQMYDERIQLALEDYGAEYQHAQASHPAAKAKHLSGVELTDAQMDPAVHVHSV